MFISKTAKAARDTVTNNSQARQQARAANISSFNNDRQHFLQKQRVTTPNKPNTRAYTRSNRGTRPKHLIDVEQINVAHEFLLYCNASMQCRNCGKSRFVLGDKNEKESKAGSVVYFICCDHCSVNVGEYKLESPDILTGDSSFSESTLRWVNLANSCKLGWVFFEKLQQHCGVKAPSKSYVYVFVHYLLS